MTMPRADEAGGLYHALNRGNSRGEIFCTEADDATLQRVFSDGLARNMRDALPNASFIGFSGPPIEQNDANTRAIFGEYVSVYDIQQAVIDKAMVPIFYESRIAKLSLNEAELPKVDSEFEDITEGEEEDRQQKLKTKWAALDALIGSEKRIRLIAVDLVQHFERRLEAMDGNAMVVRMIRRNCVDRYNELIIVIVRDKQGGLIAAARGREG